MSEGVTIEALQHVFPLHKSPPLLAPPTLAQGALAPPTSGTPQMPNNPVPSRSGEAHVVIDLPDSLGVVVISSDDEPIEDFEDHLKVEDDPEKDLQLGE